jgi:tRNA 2-selenouridine synthase
LERTQEERLDVLCEVYGTASTELLEAAFERIREKLGGLRCQQAIDALRNDDLRAAAAIGLQYYDKLYDHTQQRYPREDNYRVDGKGKTHEEIAQYLHALD